MYHGSAHEHFALTLDYLSGRQMSVLAFVYFYHKEEDSKQALCSSPSSDCNSELLSSFTTCPIIKTLNI